MITATSQQTRFDPSVTNANEIDLCDVDITVGEREILTGARVRLKSGTRYGLIGSNGCGKSTLFEALCDKLIPGISAGLRIYLVRQVEDEPSGGSDATTLEHVLKGHVEREDALQDKDILSRAIEAPAEEATRLVNEVVVKRARQDHEEAQKLALLRSGARGKQARGDEIKSERALEDLIEGLSLKVEEATIHAKAISMLQDVQTTLELLESDAAETTAHGILRGLGFSTTMIDGPYASLSGGWRSRCRLASALLAPTDLLLLDEPSNFMDLKAVLWLERYLQSFQNFSTLVVTSHDQVFLERIAEQTIALRNMQLDYFDGSPGLMQRTEAEARRAKAKAVDAMDKQRAHIESSIQKGRQMAKATNDDSRMRAVKSRQKKLDDRWGAEVSAKGTRFKLNRDLAGYHLTSREQIVLEKQERETVWAFDQPSEIKGSLVTLEKVDLGYIRGKDVLRDVSLVIHPGSRTSIVGANGQGKSTLAQAITARLAPTKGSVSTNPRLKLGYYSQHAVDSLPTTRDCSALSHFMQLFDVPEMTARASLGRIGLQGKTASHTTVPNLSGGQKVRLALAIVMYERPNLLILDEVTTHLDASTIKALARALTAYEGAIVLVTHDRWFSNAVVNGRFDDEQVAPDAPESKVVGQTLLVSKRQVKMIEGMEEYERIMLRQLDRAARKQAQVA